MHRSLHRFLRFLPFLVLTLLLLPAVSWASVTTGVIKGTVIGEDDIPIPGVLITVRSDALMGGARQDTTDDKGRYAFYELQPGTYSLLAEKAGFSKVQVPELLVQIGRTITKDIILKIQVAGEEIVVEATRPTIDTESTTKGEVLTSEFLQRVPVGQSYQAALSQTAGVMGGSNPNVSGSGYNENTYMLDGVNITDPVTGTFSVNFNFDAIEQLEIITNALDPEYGEGLGGMINIVTESGSNRLEFDTSFWYENGDWSPKIDARYAADGVELAPTGFDSQYETFSLRAKVAGPILRDRVWYIVSYEWNRSLYANTGIDLPWDFDGHYLLSKVTFQPSTTHRFTVLGYTDPTTIDNINQSDRWVKPEAQGRQTQGGYVGSLQWDWFLSPQTFLETKLTGQKTFIEITGVPCTHDEDLGYHPCDPDEAENYVDLSTPGRYGGFTSFDSDNWPYFTFDDRFRLNLTSKFSVLQVDFLGTHDLKAGIELDRTRWDIIEGYTGNLVYFDVNEVSYDADSYMNYYWAETSGPFHMVAIGDHLGTFVQDVWKPISNLTFRYGCRFDRSIQRNDQGEPVVDTALFGPRFFTAWDPWGDGKTVIRGGYGRVNDTGRLSIAAFNSQAGSFGVKYFVGEYFENFRSEGGQSFSEYDGEVTNVVWDNLVAPHADEFVLGGQRELWQDLALGVGFMARFTQNVYDYDETNLLFDEDGYGVIGYSNGMYEGIYRLRTADYSRRDYYQTDISLKKSYSDRVLVNTTYSYVVSQGSNQSAVEGSLVVPQQMEYGYGSLYTDVRHQVKAAAAWDIPNDPWTTRVGFALEYYSGFPYSRYYYSDFYSGYGIRLSDRGTYLRTEPEWWLNLLVQQSFPVKKGQLTGLLEVDNVFNNQAADNWNLGYVYYENRWVITSRQEPLRLLAAVRYQY